MKISDTISVNPGKSTLGHAEAPSIFRNPVIGTESVSKPLEIVKVLFPSTTSGVSEYKKYDLPLRTLFATILIVSGITMLSVPYGIYDSWFAITTLCFGGFLTFGLLTRPIMAAAAVFYCISGALALRSGVADITVFSLMFGCAIFCVTGSGKYSCDSLIRHGILRHRIKAEKKRKDAILGYKAFHNINF